MEKHKCGLCFRCFSSGRALGGHMRRHVSAAAHPPELPGRDLAVEGAEGEELAQAAAYVLRENPRKSFRLVDPESSSAFAAAVPAASSSVVVQDGESETESPCSASAAPRRRRRSKRPRPSSPEPPPEPASSASDVTTEEDVARFLMMLSRGSWTAGKESPQPSDGDEEEGDGRRMRPPRRGRSRYNRRACRNVFRSYQALGGRRASHHNPDGCVPAARSRPRSGDVFEGNADAKVHECPFCFRVFASGQALGGHKRSHLASSAATIAVTSHASVPAPSCSPPTTSTFGAAAKYSDGFGLIDLNLPAPQEDDAALSAVSDAEFIANSTVS